VDLVSGTDLQINVIVVGLVDSPSERGDRIAGVAEMHASTGAKVTVVQRDDASRHVEDATGGRGADPNVHRVGADIQCR